MLLFEFVERFRVAQGQADVVESFEQAVAAEGIDGESCREAVIVVDQVILERDVQVVVVDGRGALKQKLDLIVGQCYQQDAVLAGVRMKDVGEAGCDDDAEAVVVERPRSMFTRRPAAEVLAGDEDLRALVLRAIDLEVGILAPVMEEEVAVTGALDPLQELLGDDLVGVDVRAIERHHLRSVFAKRLH